MNPCTYCGAEDCPGCAQCDECGIEYHEGDLIEGLCEICHDDECDYNAMEGEDED